MSKEWEAEVETRLCQAEQIKALKNLSKVYGGDNGEYLGGFRDGWNELHSMVMGILANPADLPTDSAINRKE